MGAAQSTSSLPLPSTCVITYTSLPSAPSAAIRVLQNPITSIYSKLFTLPSVAKREPSSTTTSDTLSPTVITTTSPSTAASSLSSSSSTITSTQLPTATGTPQYLFVYGDSYTSIGFSMTGTMPSLDNPMGNPTYPGHTSTGSNQANWVDILTTNSPPNILTFDFAHGGASVDNTLTQGAYNTTPSFADQASTFLTNLATKTRKSYASWTAANSVHLIWFGRNDVYWQIVQNNSMTARLDAVQASYIKTLNKLWMAGARRFVVMGMGPMPLEPAWSLDQAPYNVWAPGVAPGTAYWNTNLPKRLAAWKKGKPAVKLSFFDTQPAFMRVLNNPSLWGLISGTCRNDDPAQYVGCERIDGRCPFADTVHPGPKLALSVGMAVGGHLVSTGFLKSWALS